MNALPRVTTWTRERVAKEFDEHGAEACVAELIRQLKKDNPEFLDIASKYAADLSDPSEMMLGFGMFYRLLVVASVGGARPSLPLPLPRITPETRDLLVEEIDEKGIEEFTRQVLDHLEESNPELLQMAHNFASVSGDYLRLMQGFGLLYRSLMVQSATEQRLLH